MTPIAADVALLTDRRYTAAVAAAGYLGNILHDDRLLQEALAARGLSSARLDWADPRADWPRYRIAVFRTTWDYFDRFGEFTAWLDRFPAEVPLCNDRATIRWNWDKHYLADLEAQGIPVVPSRFLERGSTAALAEVLEEAGWDEAVLKPCVSGAARHTYRVDRTAAAGLEPTVRRLLAGEALLLQPFQREVPRQGEDSLVVIGGELRHAVRKIPKPGDFRVQDDHGGTLHELRPDAEQRELAERAMAACDPFPAYGRVDMVRDNDGRMAIMELELIEPELWLRRNPPAAIAFAEAIARRCD
jgi:glutathione synthase/RimK-type ligase-like ATP-grasp enzyme